MVKRELNRRSPLRALERSTRGGLGRGELGAIAARKGVGKTACLVHIAMDQLFQGKHVIHVSFSANPSHIIDWYENIFTEISKEHHLDAAMEVHDEVIKRRIIMSFNQQGTRLPQVIHSLQSMIQEGNFLADCIIVDGYDFTQVSAAQLREIREFADARGLRIWFSVTLREAQPSYDERGVPEILAGLLDEIAVLICLKPEGKQIRLELVKDRVGERVEDLRLALDPKTLLIAAQA